MRSNTVIFDLSGQVVHHALSLLTSEGYRVESVEAGPDVCARIMVDAPSLMILTVIAGAEDSFSLLGQLRRLSPAPIITIGHNPEKELLKAILEGADTYLRNPVHPQELLYRIRNLLWRSGIARLPRPADHEALKAIAEDVEEAGKPFTETELRLVASLMEKPGHILGHKELMTRIWGRPVTGERLRFFVHSVRQKLSHTGLASVQTRKGVGYRLVQASPDRQQVANQ